MTDFRTEGIVLHSLNFKERDQILTLFSSDLGVQKFFCKGRKASPLTRVEIVYREKKSNLHACHELSVLSHYLELRRELSVLNEACRILQAIVKTQFPGKPAPLLYVLLCYYLAGFARAADPELVADSFLLKMLKHEGALADFSCCSVCRDTLSELFLCGGEGFCKSHAPSGSVCFNETEFRVFIIMLESKNLSEILPVSSSESFKEKINFLLREFFQLAN